MGTCCNADQVCQPGSGTCYTPVCNTTANTAMHSKLLQSIIVATESECCGRLTVAYPYGSQVFGMLRSLKNGSMQCNFVENGARYAAAGWTLLAVVP